MVGKSGNLNSESHSQLNAEQMRKSQPARVPPKGIQPNPLAPARQISPNPRDPVKIARENIIQTYQRLGGIEPQRTLLVSHWKEKDSKLLTMHLTCFAHSRNGLYALTQVDSFPRIARKNVPQK
jgi:hypothetical protein